MKKYSFIIFCFMIFSMFQVVWAEDNIMEEASTLGKTEIVTVEEHKVEESQEGQNNVDQNLPLDFYGSKLLLERERAQAEPVAVSETKPVVTENKSSAKEVSPQKPIVVSNKGYLRFIAKKNARVGASQREQIVSAVETASKKYKVRSSLIMAIIWKESTFQSHIKNGPCHGLMQLHSAYSGLRMSEIYQIEKNILCGTRELSSNLKRYHGNEIMALTAYNVGVGNVARGNYKTSYAKSVLAKEQQIISFARK